MPIPAHYSETIVTPQRSRIVEAIWSYVATEVGKGTVLPDGRCDIIMRFNVYDGGAVIPIITGPATMPYQVSFAPGDAWVGIRLRPEHGSIMWSSTIADASNTVLRGEPVFDRLPVLAALLTVEPKVSDVSSALIELPILTVPAAKNEKITQAIERVHLSGGRIRIEALAASISCSSRHLSRMFYTSVGLSAKVYSSLVQFHRVLGLIRNENLSLVEAAYEAGYADQAHMARAVRKYSGFTPANLPSDLTTPDFFG